MKNLKMCPKCHSELKVSSDGETQYCPVCRYWTKTGTARLDSLMIYEWGVAWKISAQIPALMFPVLYAKPGWSARSSVLISSTTAAIVDV